MIELTRLLFPQVPGSHHLPINGSGSAVGQPTGLTVLWEYQEEGWTQAEVDILLDDLAGLRASLSVVEADPEANPGLLDMIRGARRRGLSVALQLRCDYLSLELARELAGLGLDRVTIQLFGTPTLHDRLRGKPGAHAMALQSLHNCQEAGLSPALRFELTRSSWLYLSHLFELVEREGIRRVEIHHRIYGVDGAREPNLLPAESRHIIDSLMAKAIEWRLRDQDFQLFTIGNEVDAFYAYLSTRKKDRDRAARMWQALSQHQGNRSGVRMFYIDRQGDVHPDRYALRHSFGNVRAELLSQILKKARHPILLGLRDRHHLLTGRCSTCRWLPICNGNSRARAEAAFGDYWAPDPSCYLTEEEISTVPSL